jgi:hypothetical protein
MGAPVNVVDSNGETRTIDESDLAGALAQGYRVEGSEARADRVTTAARNASSDAGGALAAGILRTATFGGSDAILHAVTGGAADRELQVYREAHPGLSAAGEIAGAALDPFGAYGALGAIGRGAEGATAAGRIGKGALGAAAEGAGFGAGGYVSDVALGDRDLTAEGAIGAMGKGAFWGGAAGGLLAAGGEGLMAARRLFPRQDVTAAAVDAAEQEAANHVSIALNDADVMDVAATRRLRQMREVAAAGDPQVAADLAAGRGADPQDLEAALRGTQDRLAGGESLGDISAGRSPRAAFAGGAPDLQPTGPLTEADVPEEARVSARFRTLGEEPPVWQTGSQADVISAGRPQVNLYGGAPKTPSQGALDALNASLPKTAAEAAPLLPAGDDALNAIAAKADPAIADLAKSQEALRQSKYQMQIWAGRIKPSPIPEGLTGPFRPWNETASAASPDEAVAKALSAPTDDIDADLQKTADTISQHEAAAADVAEKLGNDAPQTAQEHAQQFRAAQAHASAAQDQQVAEAGQAMDAVSEHAKIGATPAGAGTADDYAGAELAGGGANAKPPNPGGGRKPKGVIGGLMDAATTLRMMGVPIPSPHMIPVVGPVLDAVLKARVLRKAFGRFGGQVEATTETLAASKAAQTITRVNSAVDAMLEAGPAVARAAQKVGAPAAALGHALFVMPGQKPTPASKDLATNYLARADELAQAQQPGMIAKAVKARCPAADPTLTDAMIRGYTAQLGYLYQTMPKPDAPAPLVSGVPPWVPGRVELMTWASRVAASHDPAAVLERVAAGAAVKAEEIDTVQVTSRSLFGHAQQRLLTKAASTKVELPHARRVQLSTLFGFPLDESMRPMTAGFLQSAYAPGASQPAPPQPAGRSTLAGPMNVGPRTANRIDGGT